MKNRSIVWMLLPVLLSAGISFADDQDFLNELARKYAPELREHEKEQFPLANAQWIWERSGILFNGQRIVQPGDIPKTDLSKVYVTVDGKREPIMRSDKSQRVIKGLALEIPEKFYGSTDGGRKARPVCYAHPVRSEDNNSIDIVYAFFNPYNGTASSGIPGVTSILDKLGVGHHEGDIEHVTVRLDRSGQRIKGVHYARHGSTEGSWYTKQSARMKDADGYKLNDNGQLVTWSALDTHGNSNRAGSLKRKPPIGIFAGFVELIGVLVEKTSDKGKSYDCRNMLEILTSENPSTQQAWMNFRGVWGRPKPPKASKGGGGPTGLLDKRWWMGEPGGPQ